MLALMCKICGDRINVQQPSFALGVINGESKVLLLMQSKRKMVTRWLTRLERVAIVLFTLLPGYSRLNGSPLPQWQGSLQPVFFMRLFSQRAL